MEYLELQSEIKNGWISFDKYGSIREILRKRFGCRISVAKSFGMILERKIYIIDIDSFKNNVDFEYLLGYISTNIGDQMKGAKGYVK